MRISDWSSDVCSSDLFDVQFGGKARFRKKSYDLQLDVFDGHDDDLTLADFVGSQDSALAVIDPVPGKTSVRNFVGDYSGLELTSLDSKFESSVADFMVTVTIYEGYLTIGMEVGRVMGCMAV